MFTNTIFNYKATKELDMRRMELVAKGKERNKELLELSELKYKAHEILQYQQVRKLQVNGTHYIVYVCLYRLVALRKC